MSATSIIALLYTVIAILAGAFFCRKCFHEKKSIISRVAWCWVTLTAIAFFVPIPVVYYLLTAFTLARFCPQDLDGKLLFYAAMMPAIPSIINWQVPFPGINFLVELDYLKVLNIVILVPLLLKKDDQTQGAEIPKLSLAVLFVALYIICTTCLDWRENSFTNSGRMSVDAMWLIGLPILAILKVSNKPENIDSLLFGLLVAGFILAFISLFQAILGWKLYTEISRELSDQYGHLYNIHYTRGSFLRTPGTMTPIPMSIYMSFSAILLYKFRGQSNARFLLTLISLVFLFAIFTTGSRAGMLSLIMAFGVYFFLNPRLKSFRGLAVFTTLLLLFFHFLMGSLPNLNSFSELDEHGTFEYRVSLFYVAIEYIKDNFLFGVRYYREDPALELLRQGQGIIDIVNAFLHIAMRYGMTGLMLFLLSIISIIAGLLRARKNQESLLHEDNYENTIRTIIAIIVAFLISITTVGFVDKLENYFWLFITMGLCVIHQQKGMARSTKLSEITH